MTEITTQNQNKDQSQSNINYIKLEKGARSCMRLSSIMIFGGLLITATLVGVLAIKWGTLGNIIVGACWGVALVYIIAVPNIRYSRYRYCIDEEAIRVREGILWIKEQIVPMERLHKIAVSQGPIARKFKLSAVEVTTAGGDMSIKFLQEEKASEIAEALKKKINAIAIMEREKG